MSKEIKESIDLKDPPFSIIECLLEVIASLEADRGDVTDHYYEAKQIWDAVLSLAEVVEDDV